MLKFDNKTFPYVVPQGSKIGKTMTCARDLYLTYNHCIYMPHMNQYIPSYRMNLQQDKTKLIPILITIFSQKTILAM